MFLTGVASEESNEYALASFEMKQDANQKPTWRETCQRWCKAAFPAGVLHPLRGIFGLAWAIVRYTLLYCIVVVELNIKCCTV